MPSPRKHPSLYPDSLSDIFRGPGVTVSFPTPQRARNTRLTLYALRESLRAHPHYNPELLKHANATTLSLNGSALIISNKGA